MHCMGIEKSLSRTVHARKALKVAFIPTNPSHVFRVAMTVDMFKHQT